MTHTLFIITRNQQEYAEGVQKLNIPGLRILAPRSPEEVREEDLRKVTIIFGAPPLLPPYINRMPNVRWVQSTFVGVDALMAENLRRDYLLTNVRDLYGGVMAEYVLGYILSFEKEIREYGECQRERRWNQHPTQQLSQKTIGIMGTGSIGSTIAKALKAFDASVIGFHTSTEMRPYFDRMYSAAQCQHFLSQLDYLVLALPATRETTHILREDTLRFLRPSAIVINVGRGNAIDETALLDALRRKAIRAAVLDVFETEPLPPTHPLWAEPHCLITPHVSGYIISHDIVSIFADNYRRLEKGEPLRYLIDFTRGY